MAEVPGPDEGICQFVGIRDLNEQEQAKVRELAALYHPKFTRALQNLINIKVHVKTYEVEGKQKKYSIHVHCKTPKKIISSTRASDWDLARTLHKAFKDVENQVMHIYKKDSSRQKPYE